MANFIVSYDLNGPRPSHQQMDEHLEKLGVPRGRILETVWYVGHPGSLESLYEHVASILGSEDSLLVVEANEALWANLLVNQESLVSAWNENR